MSKSLVEMAAELIQAQVATKSMSQEEITLALQTTYKTLQSLQNNEQSNTAEELPLCALTAGMSPDKSIQKNKIICLECGQEFKMLSNKHLTSHGLTGREYRKKYGLKLRQPLCAKALSAKRKQAGIERGIPKALETAIAVKKEKNLKRKGTAAKTSDI